jgi:hypothetical protein
MDMNGTTISPPILMYVGNQIVNGSKYGKTPVEIVMVKNGRVYAENGHSWKYAIPVD